MNLKTMLLASAAVLFAAQAGATDITNPFYLPSKGKVFSETRIEEGHTKVKAFGRHFHGKARVASEELTLGVADNFAVYGGISNDFMWGHHGYNNDHNFSYDLGLKYNVSYDRWIAQFGLEYNTYDPRTWYGKRLSNAIRGNNRWEKELGAYAKLGYEAGCGFTPYTVLAINGEIDKSDRTQEYSWFLGAHKQVRKVAVDAGVRYDFTNDKKHNNGINEEWYAQADVDYYVRDNVTVGAYGEYYLGGEAHNRVDYGYTTGLALKVQF